MQGQRRNSVFGLGYRRHGDDRVLAFHGR